MRVLFIQGRSQKGGAQTCLARLIFQLKQSSIIPVLLCGKKGWLTNECQRMGVSTLIEDFPSSRSIYGRLFANNMFARRVNHHLELRDLVPQIIFANDYLEGLIGIGLEKEIGAKTIMLLRSSGMNSGDYKKYKCRDYDVVAAIGDQLNSMAREWDSGKEIERVYDGISSDEFLAPKAHKANRPGKILIIGSELPSKGWADISEAMRQLQESTDFDWSLDFTGNEPDPRFNNMFLANIKPGTFNFLGKRDAFRELVRKYDLVINPSRRESFGMAAIEVLAAGVPLLSTRTGVMEKIQSSPRCLVSPSSPECLASAIKYIYQYWGEVDFRVGECQNNIRKYFLINNIASRWENLFLSISKS